MSNGIGVPFQMISWADFAGFKRNCEDVLLLRAYAYGSATQSKVKWADCCLVARGTREVRILGCARHLGETDVRYSQGLWLDEGVSSCSSSFAACTTTAGQSGSG